MATTVSGKGLRCTFDAGPTSFSGVTSSDVQEVGDELDATDAESAPYLSTDIGCTGLKVQIKGNSRVDGITYVEFKMGTILTNVKIYPHGTTNPAWEMAEAIVLPGSQSSTIRGKVEYTLNIASRGAFVYPEPV